MNASNSNKWHNLFCALTMGALLLASQSAAVAASGTWTESTGDGLWSNGANWSGAIADGAGNTADFSMVDLDAAAVGALFAPFYRNAVQLDTPRTIGNLSFGDAAPASPGGWEIYSNDYGTNVLTLEGATPTISATPIGPIDTGTLGAATPELLDDAIIRPSLAGTSGLTKTGAGIVTLAGPANTITGPININTGTLRFDSAIPATAPINLANGATIGLGPGAGAGMNAVGGRVINVAPGSTVNISVTASAELGRMVADNATLNVDIGGTGVTFTPSGDWNLTGSPTAINITSANGGIFRFGPNLGGGDPAQISTPTPSSDRRCRSTTWRRSSARIPAVTTSTSAR